MSDRIAIVLAEVIWLVSLVVGASLGLDVAAMVFGGITTQIALAAGVFA